MADKKIGELPGASGVYDDTLFVAEQQGKAVKIPGRLLRGLTGGSGGGGSVGYTGGGYIEMTESIPADQRNPDTLFGLILKTYS